MVSVNQRKEKAEKWYRFRKWGWKWVIFTKRSTQRIKGRRREKKCYSSNIYPFYLHTFDIQFETILKLKDKKINETKIEPKRANESMKEFKQRIRLETKKVI